MSSRHTVGRIVTLAAPLAIASVAFVATADPPSVSVELGTGVPLASYDASALIDAQLRADLSSGLPRWIGVDAFAYDVRGGVPLAVAPRRCESTYDAWSLQHVVRVREPGRDVRLRLSDAEAVVRTCLQASHVTVGAPTDYASSRGRQVMVSVLATYSWSPIGASRGGSSTGPWDRPAVPSSAPPFARRWGCTWARREALPSAHRGVRRSIVLESSALTLP